MKTSLSMTEAEKAKESSAINMRDVDVGHMIELRERIAELEINIERANREKESNGILAHDAQTEVYNLRKVLKLFADQYSSWMNDFADDVRIRDLTVNSELTVGQLRIAYQVITERYK